MRTHASARAVTCLVDRRNRVPIYKTNQRDHVREIARIVLGLEEKKKKKKKEEDGRVDPVSLPNTNLYIALGGGGGGAPRSSEILFIRTVLGPRRGYVTGHSVR